MNSDLIHVLHLSGYDCSTCPGSAAIDEQRRDIRVTLQGGFMQWRFAVTVPGVNIRAMRDKQFCNFFVEVGSRICSARSMQRRLTFRMPGVDVGAGSDKRLHFCFGLEFDGIEQRSVCPRRESENARQEKHEACEASLASAESKHDAHHFPSGNSIEA
jgi:hypothetical protein